MATVPFFRVHMYGKQAEQDGKDTHSGTWNVSDSPSTEIYTGTSADKHSIISWEDGHNYQLRKTTIGYVIRPGLMTMRAMRMANCHSTPALPGSWFWGRGVSPIAMDYYSTVETDDHGGGKFEGLTISCEPTGTFKEMGSNHNYHWSMVSVAEWNAARVAGTLLCIELEIGWGHISLPFHGYIKAWVNKKPVLDVQNICTHFLNDYGSDGSTTNLPPKPADGQKGVSLWPGGYITPSDGYPATEIATYDYALPMVGKDLPSMLLDINRVIFSMSSQDTHSTVGGSKSHSEVLNPIDTSMFNFRGSITIPDPTPPPLQETFTWSPAQPTVGIPTIFTVSSPRAGVIYSWDRTGDDATEGTGKSFVYTYSMPGQKTVKMYANGVLAASKTFNVNDAPAPDPVLANAQKKIDEIKVLNPKIAAAVQATLDYSKTR